MTHHNPYARLPARDRASTFPPHRLIALLAGLFVSLVFSVQLYAQEDANANQELTAEDVEARIETLEKPMYTPFVELYLLEESKALRKEMQNTRAELIEKVVDKELSVADKTMAYASDTVTYFFYLIAGATSILVLIGWNSIRDMRNQLTSLAEKRVNELVVEYEARLKVIEEQLQQKSDIIHQNQEEIERTNEVHSLWLKASQETSQQNKISVYDQILDLRPDDVEALSYKADAVLELQEPLWAISLCLRALKLAPDNGHAHYQLACAYAEIGRWEDAVNTLGKAIEISEAYRDDASVDPSFARLHDHDNFRALVFTGEPERSDD
ncbi:tetratricopeptide repeat protein [Marinobacter sp.]|uniref:TPR end-of-group domain-containing protein n=1 Tax=Marinobacter sp. TaxID=50741 RepID=UPI00198DF51E|nr:tetratricopeptide repeat protein [Marinobacter sp.]MBD3657093.1 tetratricopeptide repeat protein [Marinobacter sp.]